MKKAFIALFAIAALSACSTGTEEATAPSADTALVPVVSDSTSADTCVTPLDSASAK